MLFYALAAICAVGVVFVAGRLVRRFGKATDDADPGGPTGGHAGSMISAMFLLAFAIAIVVPWTTADAARLNTYAESQAVAEAYWSSEQLPSPAAEQAQTELLGYVDLVRGPEWRLMSEGRLTSEGWARLESLRRTVTALQVKGDDVEEAKAATLDHIREISSSRRQRAMDAATTPPAWLLATTVFAGLAVILLPFLLGARPVGLTLLPLALMAGLLGGGIYLALDISRIFAGALGVQPDAFTSVLPELQRISGIG